MAIVGRLRSTSWNDNGKSRRFVDLYPSGIEVLDAQAASVLVERICLTVVHGHFLKRSGPSPMPGAAAR